MISPDGVLSGVAALGAAATGYAVYRTNRAARRTDDAAIEGRRVAEVARAEVESWKTLIETLTVQYEQGVRNVARLQAEVNSLHAEVRRLELEVEKIGLDRMALVEDLVKARERLAIAEAQALYTAQRVEHLEAQTGAAVEKVADAAATALVKKAVNEAADRPPPVL